MKQWQENFLNLMDGVKAACIEARSHMPESDVGCGVIENCPFHPVCGSLHNDETPLPLKWNMDAYRKFYEDEEMWFQDPEYIE